jgi:methionine synthase II (cobalamin-independent)
MTKAEYLEKAFELYNKGKIDAETYDAMIMNADVFCED